MGKYSPKLQPKKEFLSRVLTYFWASFLLILFSLGIGIVGYHHFGHLNWVDSLYNASMILTGMGPVDKMETDAAKIFSSFYALFSGVAFLSTFAIFISPFVHRILHVFHIDETDMDVNLKE